MHYIIVNLCVHACARVRGQSVLRYVRESVCVQAKCGACIHSYVRPCTCVKESLQYLCMLTK